MRQNLDFDVHILYAFTDSNMARMNSSTIERALAALGDQLGRGGMIEVVLVGGAAGMLTGVLAASRTTFDCDVMAYVPKSACIEVETAAEHVAKDLGLAEHWFNSDVRMRADALPRGWEKRRLPVGEYGRLRVMAVSRLDLIAMKALAGRAQDLEDLRSMRVREDELEFVRQHLGNLAERGTTADEIEDARVLVEQMAKWT